MPISFPVFAGGASVGLCHLTWSSLPFSKPIQLPNGFYQMARGVLPSTPTFGPHWFRQYVGLKSQPHVVMGSLNQFSHVLALQGQFAENIFYLGVNANFPRRFQPTHWFWSHGRSLTCGACCAAPRRVGFEVSRIRLVVGAKLFFHDLWACLIVLCIYPQLMAFAQDMMIKTI